MQCNNQLGYKRPIEYLKHKNVLKLRVAGSLKMKCMLAKCENYILLCSLMIRINYLQHNRTTQTGVLSPLVAPVHVHAKSHF